MSESLIPVYTINDHFQGVDAQNAEQTRAEMVSSTHLTAAVAFFLMTQPRACL